MVSALIIGAGPIGLEVAWSLKREGIDYLQLDAGQVGSTMEWWAPGTRFFSSPERIAICGVPLVTAGQEKATREEYLAYLRAVALQFDLNVRAFERVAGIENRGRDGTAARFSVRTAKGEYAAANVVVAIGDMHRPRRLGVPGEDLPHVSHYFQDPHRSFRRRVLIVGGRNSAVEAAIRCWRVGAEVTMSCRRPEFDAERIKYWLLPEIKGLIKSGAVRMLAPTVVAEIKPHTVVLESAGGSRQEVEADDVLLLTGYEMDTSLLEGVGVQLEGANRAPIFNRRTMETNISGLYVAGTATAGTQLRTRVFIENCHAHGPKIAAAIAGRPAPDLPEAAIRDPES
jgi:thioredoxin reductase (NADPH)